MDNRAQSEVPRDQTRDLRIIDAFWVALHLQYARDSQSCGHPRGEAGKFGVLGSLTYAASILEDTGTGDDIVPKIESCKNRIRTEYEDAKEDLEEGRGPELETEIRTWLELLQASWKTETRINIKNRGIFDYEQLVNNPSHLFEIETWEAMDNRPKKDISEACRCLAVDANTATVMISLRAVEYYLRIWHKHETGESIDRGSLGKVLDTLMEEFEDERHRSARLSQRLSSLPSVLSNIYYLKEKRNEITHLEKDPNDYDAIMTLLTVCATITEIFEEIDAV